MSSRVILIDDHPLIRECLRWQLETTGRFQVVGEAGDADEAIRLMGEQAPNLAVMDIGLRGPKNGLELTRIFCSEFPALAVVILTMHDGEEYALQAVRRGARGYLLKDSPMTQIVTAIEAVATGGTYYAPSVMSAVTRGRTQSTLSPRERQILDHLLEGYSSKEIARALDLSVRTVETHRQSINRKLGTDCAVDLVKRALKMGLAQV